MGNSRLTFGILVDWPDHSSMYHGNLLKGIRSFAAKHDINLLTLVAGRLDSPDEMERDRELLYDFIDNKRLFSGFILFSSTLSSFSGIERLLEKTAPAADIPSVSIAIDLPGMPSVMIDSKPGLEELVEHMILHHGYTDIAYISGPEKNEEAEERLDTVRRIFSKHGLTLPESHLYFGAFTLGSGTSAIKCFLDERKIRPEAVICANDYMALGAWKELENRGIVIPEDIAVTGFDDLQISEISDLPFTTVKQPLFSQGYCAAEKLYRAVRKQKDTRVESLPSRVVYRHSCGCDINSIKPPAGNELPGQEPVDSITEEYRLSLHDAFESSVREHGNTPLIRCWRKITQSALKKRLRKSVLTNLLRVLKHEYQTGDYPDEIKKLIDLNIDKLQLMTIEAYIRQDSLNRITDTMGGRITVTNIENLGTDIQNLLEMEDRLRSVDWFFSDTGIDNCYLYLFDNLRYEKNGDSNLIFCRKDGEETFIPENKMSCPTKQLIHSEYLPRERYEMLVELLFDHNDIFGLLTLDMKEVQFSFYEMLRTRFNTIIHDSMYKKELKDAIQRLKDLSLRDELTGLYNRRGFFTISEQQLRYCMREKKPYAVYYIDLDGLKDINDKLGHDEGDNAIKSSADIIKLSFRDTDIIARLGGDEFAVFASNTNEKNAETIYDRFYKSISRANSENKHSFKISMSIGTCFSSNLHTDDPAVLLDEMLKTADNKMYENKKKNKE